MDLTLKQMQEDVKATWENYLKQGTKPWSTMVAITDLSYQVGSLAKLILQKEDFRFKKNLADQDITIKAKDEIADILAVTLYLAQELNINVEEAWEAMKQSDLKKIDERS